MDTMVILILIVLLIALVTSENLLILRLRLEFLWISIFWVTGEVLLILLIICERTISLIEILSIAELEKLKCLSVLIPDIIHSRQAVQIVDQMQHFFISLVIVEWNDGDTVVNLKCKAVHAIVHNDHIF